MASLMRPSGLRNRVLSATYPPENIPGHQPDETFVITRDAMTSAMP